MCVCVFHSFLTLALRHACDPGELDVNKSEIEISRSSLNEVPRLLARCGAAHLEVERRERVLLRAPCDSLEH